MILIVDDHADTCYAMVRLLRADGYEVAAVSNGREALAFMENSVPGLIFLDYSMPEMDGLEVLRTLRKDPRLGKVPVIMFSAFDGPQRLAAIAAGVDAHIVKGSLDWVEIRREVVRFAGPGEPVVDPPTPGGDVEKRTA